MDEVRAAGAAAACRGEGLMPPLGGNGEGLRARQERELATRHLVAVMEYALAREAVSVGLALEAAGLAFDPLTFVAMRVLEASVAEHADPAETLEWLVADGCLERTVALAVAGIAAGDAD